MAKGDSAKEFESADLTQSEDDDLVAAKNWSRYVYMRDSGHMTYMQKAKELENYYLGGGRQWALDDRASLESEGKPVLELNEILPVINTILGYQINHRLDAQLLPRRQSDERQVESIEKVIRQILDHNQFDWLESEVFADGLIQQRGYYDIRMSFEDNLYGEVELDSLDPLDVIPDPHANKYDPDSWRDATVTRWFTIDDIEDFFGKKKAGMVEGLLEGDWADDSISRNGFGNQELIESSGVLDSNGDTVRTSFSSISYFDPDMMDRHLRRVRVLDRQHWKRVKTKMFVNPDEGDMRQVPETWDEDRAQRFADKNGLMIMEKIIKRVRWTMTAGNVVLHDDWSPYKHFTIVPYFAYFRRGKTIGAVDNLVSPQDQLNKMSSQALHIANTTSNSGWVVEENSLVDMDIDDLERDGGKTGLIIHYRRGSEKPDKIKPNNVPTAIDRIIDRSSMSIETISGAGAAFKGENTSDVSGRAIEARQAHSALHVAGPLDNLARTRHLVVQRILELIQQFYTDERVVMITGHDKEGRREFEHVTINEVQPDGSIINDMTLGEYGVVVHSVPSQATYESNQMNQLLEMRKMGMNIPDDEIVERSNIGRKSELAERIRQMQQGNPELEELGVDELKAKIKKLLAETEKTEAMADKAQAEANRAEATVTSNSIEAATILSQFPKMARVADGVRQTTRSRQ